MTRIKICGVRTADNALMVAGAGADMIGLNFYPKSPRYIEPSLAREIANALRREFAHACPILIGVFVNASASEIRAIVAEVGLDFAQLSGDESPETVEALPGIAFKAIRPANESEALRSAKRFAASAPTSDDAPGLLVDAFNPKLYGGTGETTSIEIAQALKALCPRLMLAGGLTPDNITARVNAVRPWAVDVASGVEDGTPGIKDERKVQAFVKALRSANA